MSIWTPDLDGRIGPKYLQIVEALAEDIASAVLKPGVRLPPHRELAYRLGLSPNTTSRAYAEATARALVSGEVGRGTFVREPGGPPPGTGPADMLRPQHGPIDLSRNLPYPGTAAGSLAKTLSRLGRSGQLDRLVDYQTEADPQRHAEAAVEWMRRTGVAATSGEITITCGAQHGILSVLMAITRPGDLLLVEELTYPPVKAMAHRLGLKLASVAMDEDGICPDDLNRLCTGRAPRALYVMPTLQTPTTVTLDAERRIAVAEIARRHGLLVIEDDVFGHLKADRPPPIAALAAEHTIYVTSTSKCLAPGLRVGFVRSPAPLADAIRSAVNLSCWMPPPLMAEIAAEWIGEGTAERLTVAQRRHASRRQDIARTILDGHDFRADPSGLHLWMSVPRDWRADAFKDEAARRDVKITEGTVFAANQAIRPHAVRLCLSHEPSEERLRQGLETIAGILDEGSVRSNLVL